MTKVHPRGAALARQPRALGTGLGLVLLSTAVYGVTPSLVALSRGEVSVIDMVAYRSAVAALLFFALARIRRAHRRRRAAADSNPPVDPLRPGAARGLLIGAALFGPQVMLYYASFSYINTSLAVAIGFVYPTIVLLLAALMLRLRPPSSDLGLSALALVGIAALLLPGSGGGVHPAGVALAVLAAFGYALYVLLADSLLQDVDLFEVGAQVSLGAAFSAIATGLVIGRLGVLSDPQEILVVCGQAVLIVVATGCYYGGLMRLGSSQASLVDTAQPGIALVAGAVLLGERMVAIQVVGVALVTASVALSSVIAHRRAAVPYADPP